MPFKIVQTIENGKNVLSAVPSNWEENNILYWPNKRNKLRTLLVQEYSLPDKQNWQKFACILKREGIENMETAEFEIEIMEGKSDTETEDISYINTNRRSPKKKLQRQYAEIDMPNFNDNVPLAMQDSVNSIGTSQHTQVKQQNQTTKLEPAKPIICILENQTLDTSINSKFVLPNNEQMMPISTDEQTETIGNNFIFLPEENDNYFTKPANELTVTPSVDESRVLNNLLENQNIIIAQQIKLQNSIDALASLISKENQITKAGQKNNENLNDFILKPVDSEEELNSLEQKLADGNYLKKIIDSLTFVCGKTGKSNGLDCSYKLIDYFVTRKFLVNCSWTGNTRKNDKPKIPLKFYTNFRKCFLTIVMNADYNFTETDCEIFFKRVLKNSVARCDGKKIVSTHKTRPKNLTYRKKSGILEMNTKNNIDQNTPDNGSEEHLESTNGDKEISD